MNNSASNLRFFLLHNKLCYFFKRYICYDVGYIQRKKKKNKTSNKKIKRKRKKSPPEKNHFLFLCYSIQHVLHEVSGGRSSNPAKKKKPSSSLHATRGRVLLNKRIECLILIACMTNVQTHFK